MKPRSDKQDTLITQLRIKGVGNDALAVRVQLSNWLSANAPHAKGLPPTAILCIQRLSTLLSVAALRSPHHNKLQEHWQKRVATQMETILREAIRPVQEAVSAQAKAVLFANPAELMACLARDWCRGTILSGWWWRGLLKTEDIRQSVLEWWHESPEYIPAALEHLVAQQQLGGFLAALSDSEVCALRQAITKTFALPELEACYRAAEATASSAFTATEILPEAEWVSPWARYVPECDSDSSLPWQKQALMGMGLMLLRAPVVIRSDRFARAVEQWLRLTLVDFVVEQPDDRSQARNALRIGREARHISILRRKNEPPDDTDKEGDVLSETEVTSPPVPRATLPEPLLEASSEQRQSSFVLVPQTDLEELAQPENRPAHSEIARSADVSLLSSQEIETHFGGLFYLVNLGLFLHLYGDFTMPRQRGLGLPLWDFLALCGEVICGPQLRQDPVWGLLAQLSGRTEAEEPGALFTAPESWRMAAEWLTPFADGRPWDWTDADGRLRVVHPVGFVVLDVPLTQLDVNAQLTQELQSYSQFHSGVTYRATPQAAVIAPTSLQCWLDWLRPYVDARLRLALGLQPEDDLSAALCASKARVRFDATQLDVFLQLEELPIAIRLSGLDRDPGWVPAAGRFIAFHFD